jgi:SWI/SNF-related matrix-associated actin-dependent regulator 1 of chromatin subfamily A
MRATRYNDATTLHAAQYLLTFDRPEAMQASRLAAKLRPEGTGSWVASAMELYAIAEASAQAGEDLPSEALEEVRKLRLAAEHDVSAREPEGLSLYDFQSEGARFLTRTRVALLADEMGLGKTVQALMAIPAQAMGMIVAPRSLVLGWVREAALWRPDLTMRAVDREDLGGVVPGEFLVATPDAVRIHHQRHGVQLCGGDTPPNSVIILDEAHLYKTADAARTEAIRILATHFDIRWALTGTPLANKPADLWGTLSSVGLASRMFGTRKRFDTIFGGVKDKRGEYHWAKQIVDPDGLRDAFRGRALRRLRRVVAPQIPQKTYSVIPHSTFPDFTPSTCGGRYEEGSLDAKFGKPVAKVQRELAESKVSVMFETVERFRESGDALVVFSANVGPLESLRERYGCDLVIGDATMQERDDAVRKFQQGETKLIGLQTKAGGVGLTLTAAHHLLYVQRDWSVADGDQAEDRICRLGQKHTCVIYDILSEHPLDQIIRKVLDRKTALMSATTSAIPTEA